MFKSIFQGFTVRAIQQTGMLACMNPNGISLAVNAETHIKNTVHGFIGAATVFSEARYTRPMRCIFFMYREQLSATTTPHLCHFRSDMEKLRIQAEHRHSFGACHSVQQSSLLCFADDQTNRISIPWHFNSSFINGLQKFERIPALGGQHLKVGTAPTGI